MKKSRYSDEQTVRILREADKAPVAEVTKRHGVRAGHLWLAQAIWRDGCQRDKASEDLGARECPAEEATG